MNDLEAAIEVFDQRRAAFHPVAIVQIVDAGDFPVVGCVDVPADHAIAVALAGLANVYDAANLDLSDAELDRIHRLVQSTGW